MKVCRGLLLLVPAIVSACSQTQDRPPVRDHSHLEPVITTSLFEPTPTPPQYQKFQNLESVLDYRRLVCSLTEPQRKALIETHQLEKTPDSVMGILMLASCAPDKTPGLLANSLVEARRLQEGPKGFHALVDLMAAQLRSYSLVERQLRDAENRLDRLVTGIREIEAEMSGKGSSAYD